jgi:hypothetical protein
MILEDNESLTVTYQETLFFVAQCLTITLEEKNRSLIEQKLQKQNVDWDKVVQLSTSHYVLPAMYCNLKRVDFLKYLPDELVSYMSHITQLNRARNLQIISQAKALNQLLRAHNITPVFLKGTGNLLEGLYEDHEERMVGDIDFIVSQEEYPQVIELLKNDNYTKQVDQLESFPEHRHYQRLVKDDCIAAVEIHKELVIEKYRNEFNYKVIFDDIQLVNNISVLSFENQLILSIIAIQINDYGFKLEKFSLRNAYDVFLLSKKVNTKKVFSNLKGLKNPLNCFLASCDIVFGEIESIEYHQTKQASNYIKNFNKTILKRNSSFNFQFKSKIITIKRRFLIVCRSIFNAKNRTWLFRRIVDFISKNKKQLS